MMTSNVERGESTQFHKIWSMRCGVRVVCSLVVITKCLNLHTSQRENLRQLQTRWQCDNTSLFPFKRWVLEVMKVWPSHRLNFLAGVLEWLRVLLAGRADPLVGAAAVAVGALRTNQRWAVWSVVTWPALHQSQLTSLPEPELLVLMLRWPHCPDSDVTLQLSSDNILDSLLEQSFCNLEMQKLVKTWGRWLWWQSRVSFFFPLAGAPSDQDFPPSSWLLLLFPGKYELW